MISNFAKIHGCGSKIEPATLTLILNFKWAWQTRYLSHAYQTLENYSFYVDEQMILLSFLSITNQKLAYLEKPIFSLNSRPLTVEFEGFSTVSGLEQREKFGFSKFANF